MNQIRIISSNTIFLIALAIACGTESFAQTSSGDNQRMIEKLVVKHASRMHAQDVLEAALAGDDSDLIPDDNGNSFVVIGSPKSIKLAKEALAKIDQKPQAAPLRTTMVFALAHANAAEVRDVIMRLLGSDSHVRVAIDEQKNELILSADEKQTAEVREIIELLDKPLPAGKAADIGKQTDDCQLRLSWLVASDSFSDPDQKMLRKVRLSLGPIAKRLQSDGSIGEIMTLTDVQTLTGNGNFRNTSSRELNIGQTKVTVVGNATPDGQNKFDLDLSMVFAAQGQQVELESRFSAPVNHPVAFSVSDIGGIRSYLVVEVESASK